MSDMVTITIPRHHAQFMAGWLGAKAVPPLLGTAVFIDVQDACRQALDNPVLSLEVDFELDPTGTVERLVELFPGGPLLVTIQPLEEGRL